MCCIVLLEGKSFLYYKIISDVQAVRGVGWSREGEARDKQVESWANGTKSWRVELRERGGWGGASGCAPGGLDLPGLECICGFGRTI